MWNILNNKVWDEITYPFPNFKSCTVEVWEWISNCVSLYYACNYFSILWLMLIYISERDPCTQAHVVLCTLHVISLVQDCGIPMPLQWCHNECDGSQITSISILCSTICSGADQRKHKSFASLAFVRGIHRWLVDSPHKGPVVWKMFPFDTTIMHWKSHSLH